MGVKDSGWVNLKRGESIRKFRGKSNSLHEMIGNWCEENVIAVNESGKMDHDRERKKGKKLFI